MTTFFLKYISDYHYKTRTTAKHLNINKHDCNIYNLIKYFVIKKYNCELSLYMCLLCILWNYEKSSVLTLFNYINIVNVN